MIVEKIKGDHMKQLLRICIISFAFFNTFSCAMETDGKSEQELESIAESKPLPFTIHTSDGKKATIPKKFEGQFGVLQTDKEKVPLEISSQELQSFLNQYGNLLEPADQTVESLKKHQSQREWDETEKVYEQFQKRFPTGEALAKLVVGMRTLDCKNYLLQFVAEDALRKKWRPKTEKVSGENFCQLGTEVFKQHGALVPYAISYKKLAGLLKGNFFDGSYGSAYKNGPSRLSYTTWGVCAPNIHRIRLQNLNSCLSPLQFTPDFFLNTDLEELELSRCLFKDNQEITQLGAFSNLKKLSLRDVAIEKDGKTYYLTIDPLLEKLTQLEELRLENSVNHLQELPESLKNLHLEKTAIRTLPELPKLDSITFKSSMKLTREETFDLLKKTESIPQRDIQFTMEDKKS